MSSLLELAKTADTIVILGHIRPDGDCVGSCLAVCNYLKEQYPEKEISVYLETPPEKFSYLTGFEQISQDHETKKVYDLCICLDSADRERLGDFVVYLDTAKESICLDHHVTNGGYAHYNEILADASSACEVVYGALDADRISKTVAECIYTGILHDTNVFKNSNTSAKTMEIAGKMMEKGIAFGKIIDESFYRKTYAQNRILGQALIDSKRVLDGSGIYTAVRLADMEAYGVDGSDLDGIVDQLRITDGVEVAILMYETKTDCFKISMRSNDVVDVSRIAAMFGGGGHVRAAGCSMDGTPEKIAWQLCDCIEEQLKEQEI